MWKYLTTLSLILLVDAKNNFHDCGVVKVQNKVTPVHFYDSSPGQWPWFVALFHSKKQIEYYLCGSSLINEWTLITGMLFKLYLLNIFLLSP